MSRYILTNATICGLPIIVKQPLHCRFDDGQPLCTAEQGFVPLTIDGHYKVRQKYFMEIGCVRPFAGEGIGRTRLRELVDERDYVLLKMTVHRRKGTEWERADCASIPHRPYINTFAEVIGVNYHRARHWTRKQRRSACTMSIFWARRLMDHYALHGDTPFMERDDFVPEPDEGGIDTDEPFSGFHWY